MPSKLLSRLSKGAQKVASKLRRYVGKELTAGYGETMYDAAQYKWPSYTPDDLATKKGYEIYDEMQRHYQVQATLTLKMLGVLGRGYEINAQDEKDGRQLEARDFMQEVLDSLPGTFRDVLFAIMDACAKGFSIQEKVFGLRSDGRLILTAIKPKDPSLFGFDMDEYKNIRWLTYQSLSATITELPPEKFIHFVHRGKYDNPKGESDLRGAYTPWFSSTYVGKFWNIFLERYGVPPLIAHSKPNMNPDQKNDLKKILKNMQTHSVAVLPTSLAETIEQLAATQNPRELFEAAMDYWDRAISKAVLGPTLILEPSKSGGGAYALGKVHEDILSLQLSHIRTRLEDVVNDQIVMPLHVANFGEKVPAPTLSITDFEDDKMTRLADAMFKLITGGVLNPRDAEDNAHIRELLGLWSLPEGMANALKAALTKEDWLSGRAQLEPGE